MSSGMVSYRVFDLGFAEEVATISDLDGRSKKICPSNCNDCFDYSSDRLAGGCIAVLPYLGVLI
jgi:hypothetical protein